MPSFWPSGLELSDTATPMSILLAAGEEWKTTSEGLLELIMQTGETESGNDIILVHAMHTPSNRTASLLSVVMRSGLAYPARLQPNEEDLPNFFKKSYSRPANPVGITAIQNILNTIPTFEENKWVAETPSDFRRQLADAFNLGGTKSIILNLVASQEYSEENCESATLSHEEKDVSRDQDLSE